MLLLLQNRSATDEALRSGGSLIGQYPDGWLIEVGARRIGEVTYELASGAWVRQQEVPSAISYPHEGFMGGGARQREWYRPRVTEEADWHGMLPAEGDWMAGPAMAGPPQRHFPSQR